MVRNAHFVKNTDEPVSTKEKARKVAPPKASKVSIDIGDHAQVIEDDGSLIEVSMTFSGPLARWLCQQGNRMADEGQGLVSECIPRLIRSAVLAHKNQSTTPGERLFNHLMPAHEEWVMTDDTTKAHFEEVAEAAGWNDAEPQQAKKL